MVPAENRFNWKCNRPSLRCATIDIAQPGHSKWLKGNAQHNAHNRNIVYKDIQGYSYNVKAVIPSISHSHITYIYIYIYASPPATYPPPHGIPPRHPSGPSISRFGATRLAPETTWGQEPSWRSGLLGEEAKALAHVLTRSQATETKVKEIRRFALEEAVACQLGSVEASDLHSKLWKVLAILKGGGPFWNLKSKVRTREFVARSGGVDARRPPQAVDFTATHIMLRRSAQGAVVLIDVAICARAKNPIVLRIDRDVVEKGLQETLPFSVGPAVCWADGDGSIIVARSQWTSTATDWPSAVWSESLVIATKGSRVRTATPPRPQALEGHATCSNHFERHLQLWTWDWRWFLADRWCEHCFRWQTPTGLWHVFATGSKTEHAFWHFFCCQIYYASWWGGVGWGGDNTNHVSCSATWSWGYVNLQPFFIFTCTWCYAVGWGGAGIILTMSLAPLRNLGGMLTCNASWSSLVHDATLVDGVGWGGVGWGGDNTNHISCSARWSWGYVNLQRFFVFTCAWCYASWWGGVGWGGVGWGGDNTNHVSCSATWSWGFANLQITCN